MNDFLVILIVALPISAGIGWFIADEKNRDGMEGAALGCLLGPIGWIIEALLPTEAESDPVAWKCPKCGHQVSRDTVFCPNCGHRGAPAPCARCSLVPRPGDTFCRRCGNPVVG